MAHHLAVSPLLTRMPRNHQDPSTLWPKFYHCSLVLKYPHGLALSHKMRQEGNLCSKNNKTKQKPQQTEKLQKWKKHNKQKTILKLNKIKNKTKPKKTTTTKTKSSRELTTLSVHKTSLKGSSSSLCPPNQLFIVLRGLKMKFEVQCLLSKKNTHKNVQNIPAFDTCYLNFFRRQ